MLFSRLKARRGAVIVAAALAAVLSGCAHYEAYTGNDAAKVRFTYLGSSFAMNGMYASASPLANGHCGERVLNQQVQSIDVLEAERRRPIQSGPPKAPVLYPRVDMVDSPDPILSNVAEVRLAPGRYALRLSIYGGSSTCVMTPVVDLQAGHQYAIQVAPGDGQCTASGKELQVAGGGHDWRPIDLGSRARGC